MVFCAIGAVDACIVAVEVVVVVDVGAPAAVIVLLSIDAVTVDWDVGTWVPSIRLL